VNRDVTILLFIGLIISIFTKVINNSFQIGSLSESGLHLSNSNL
jgi:hypothetical protein